MTRGLFFEYDTRICNRCPVKCERVVPLHDDSGVLVGGEMEKSGNHDVMGVSKLDSLAKCFDKNKGVFGGAWSQQVLERVASGEVVNLNQEILYKLRDTINSHDEDTWQQQLDQNDWLMIGMLCNRGSEPFGQFTDELKHLSLINSLKVSKISIEDVQGMMKTVWQKNKKS